MSGLHRDVRVAHLDEGYPRRLWLSVSAALLGSLLQGYTLAVLNVPLDHVTTGGTVWGSPVLLSSASLLGAVLGAVAAMPLSQALGPRRAQHWNAVVFMVGSILSALDWAGHHGFMLGRLCAGLGAGAASIFVNTYISDIAPRELRSALMQHHQVLVSVGVFCALVAGLPYQYCTTCTLGLGFVGRSIPWWRIMLGLAALPAALQLLAMCWCPESPSWLERLDKDKADEACIALWGARAILYEDPGSGSNLGGPDRDRGVRATQRSLAAAAGGFGGGLSRLYYEGTVPQPPLLYDRATVSQPLLYGGFAGEASHQPSYFYGDRGETAVPPASSRFYSVAEPQHAPHFGGPVPQHHDQNGIFMLARGQQELQQHGRLQGLPPQQPQLHGHGGYAAWLGVSPDPSAGSGGNLGGPNVGAAWWALRRPSDPGLATALLDEPYCPSEDDAPPEQGWRLLAAFEYRRFVLLALGLPVLQQASGAAVILYYSSQVFPELAWPDEFPPVWGCVAIGAVHLAATIWSGYLADAMGRRPLLLASFSGMAACLFASAVITFFQDLQPSPNEPLPPGPTPPVDAEYILDVSNSVLLILLAFFLGLGAGPLLPRYLDELLPPRIKGRAMAAGTALGWASALVVGATFLPAIAGPVDVGGAYLVYGMSAVLALVLVALLCIETKGRSPSELEAQLRLRPAPQLRHLFPTQRHPPGGEAWGVPHGVPHGQGRHGVRGPLMPGCGVGAGGMASSDVAAEAAAAALAAQAWAKLIQHQAAQNADEEQQDKLSQSL